MKTNGREDINHNSSNSGGVAPTRDAPWRSQRAPRRSDGHRFAELFQAWGSHEVLSVDDEDDVTAPSPRPTRWGQDPWPIRSKSRGADPPRYFTDRNPRKCLNDPAPSYIPLSQGAARSPKDYIPLESEVADDLISQKYCRVNAVLVPMTPSPSLSSPVQIMEAGNPAVDHSQGFVNRVSEKMRKALESEAHIPATPAEVDNRSDTSSASSMAISHEPPPQVAIDHVQTDADESGELPEDEEEDALIASAHNHHHHHDFSIETSEISSTDPPVPSHEAPPPTIEESLQSDEGNDILESPDSPEEEAQLLLPPVPSPAVAKMPTPMVDVPAAPASPVPSSTSSRPKRRRSGNSSATVAKQHEKAAVTSSDEPPSQGEAPPETRQRSVAVRTKPRAPTLGARKSKLEKARRSAAVARRMKEEPTAHSAADNVLQTVTFEKSEVERCGLLLRTNLECSCLRNKILEMALSYRELRRQEDKLRKDLAPLLHSAGNSVLGANLISPQFDSAITTLLKAVAEPFVKEEKKSKRRRVES